MYLMNLEEVEKSIDKEINELKKSVSKLYKDWDKDFSPVERMLLIRLLFSLCRPFAERQTMNGW